MQRGCGRGLEGEPFLEAGTTKRVQAVEERERLIEEVGAYLRRGWRSVRGKEEGKSRE